MFLTLTALKLTLELFTRQLISFTRGLSAKFLDPKVKGLENQHHATYANGLTNKQVVEKFGKDNVYFKERSRKHRYIYFNARGKRKMELLEKLRYQVLPYPKEVTE